MSLAVTSEKDAVENARPPRKSRSIALWVVYLLTIVIIAMLFIDGYSYYQTPYLERPHHPDYREFRPAGSRGLLYGFIGASMMVLMLVYTIRKRTRFFGRRIPLRPFLDFHIFMGVFGPLMIVLHTSFKVQGLVAVAFWSMVAVALSGYFGRYLYMQVPRNIEDRELSLQEIDRLVAHMGQELKEKWNLKQETLDKINFIFDRAYGISEKGTFGSVVRLFLSDLRRPWLRAGLKRRLKKAIPLPKKEFDYMYHLASQRAILVRRLTVLGKVQRLFHYWHVIHKPFALIMYIIMGVHIGVAIWTGYGWF